jgi:hypothetical protein
MPVQSVQTRIGKGLEAVIARLMSTKAVSDAIVSVSVNAIGSRRHTVVGGNTATGEEGQGKSS